MSLLDKLRYMLHASRRKQAWEMIGNILPDLENFRTSLSVIEMRIYANKNEEGRLTEFKSQFTRPRHARIVEVLNFLDKTRTDRPLLKVQVELAAIHEVFRDVAALDRGRRAEAEFFMGMALSPLIKCIEAIEHEREKRAPPKRVP